MVEFLGRRRAPRAPIIGGDKPPPPLRQRRRRGRPTGPGRVFALFGPHGLDFDQLVRVLVEEAGPQATQISYFRARGHDYPLTDLAERVDAARTRARAVFLCGLPSTPSDVQWLYDRRFVTPRSVGDGEIVRMARGDVFDPHFEAILPSMEAAMIELSLPYRVVGEEDLTVTAATLFNLAELE